jgi:hypothetical protein
MKLSTLHLIVSLSCVLALTGCAGFQGASFPLVTTENSLGAIHGSVLGGHAPVVGAHVFVLEATASTTGYAAKVTSLLSGTGTTEDTSGDATNDFYYIPTDIYGGFNVTGDYTCTVGDPVYLYAQGGSSNASMALPVTAVSDTKAGTTYTYSVTTSGGSTLAAGQMIAFPGGGLGGKFSTLNGATFTISSVTGATFKFTTTTAPGTGANTQTGTVNWFGAVNPAVVNMAMLGVCPSTKNFSTIPFVYMNEVSTAALAYGMAAFAQDSLHIGTSTTNLAGLQNAALNVANLYDITGQESTTTQGDGEGHIARAVTAAGNGVVPQATLDTVGDILAACVDSANATTTLTTESANCKTLFTAATSNGIASGQTGAGTVAIDTATAAFNIAKNPGTSAVVSLYNLPRSGVMPFAPNLSSAPTDFSVGITYSGTASKPFLAPSGVAIDASGNAFVSSGAAGGYVSELSPQGAVTATSATVTGGLNSVAVDPNGNAWALEGTSPGALYQFNAGTLTTAGQYGTSMLNAPTSLSINTATEVYVADGGNDNVLEFNAAGVEFATYTSATFPCLKGVSQVTAPGYGGVFAASAANNVVCYIFALGGFGNFTFFSSGAATAPNNIALDGNTQGWVASPSQDHVYACPSFSYNGKATTEGSTAGGLNQPAWTAVDGGNNIWLANEGSNGQVAEYTNGGTAVTGTSGYQQGNVKAPSSIATDNAGNVWVTNSSSNTVTEIIGVATPATTPLSAQSPGTKP